MTSHPPLCVCVCVRQYVHVCQQGIASPGSLTAVVRACTCQSMSSDHARLVSSPKSTKKYQNKANQKVKQRFKQAGLLHSGHAFHCPDWCSRHTPFRKQPIRVTVTGSRPQWCRQRDWQSGQLYTKGVVIENYWGHILLPRQPYYPKVFFFSNDIVFCTVISTIGLNQE